MKFNGTDAHKQAKTLRGFPKMVTAFNTEYRMFRNDTVLATWIRPTKKFFWLSRKKPFPKRFRGCLSRDHSQSKWMSQTQTQFCGANLANWKQPTNKTAIDWGGVKKVLSFQSQLFMSLYRSRAGNTISELPHDNLSLDNSMDNRTKFTYVNEAFHCLSNIRLQQGMKLVWER